jgi:hypothetical protein
MSKVGRRKEGIRSLIKVGRREKELYVKGEEGMRKHE